jgi:cell division protein FtsB
VERAVVVRRAVAGIVIAGALVFAVEGGEFSTIDLFRQRQTRARLTKQIDALQQVVDSLQRYEAKLRTDPATQERIARETFGMVRGSKEILYRFADSTVSDTARKRP